MIRKSMRKNVLSFFIGLSVFFITSSASATLIDIGFNPSSITTNPGNTFSIDLIANINSLSPIVSFGLDVAFDSIILDTTNATVNTSLFDAGSIVDFSTDGLIQLTGFVSPLTNPGGLTGSLTLATMTFFGESLGMTALTPTFNMLDPTEGFARPFPIGGRVSAGDITLGTSQVNVVPEPSTLLLLGSGLACVFGFRKKLRRS